MNEARHKEGLAGLWLTDNHRSSWGPSKRTASEKMEVKMPDRLTGFRPTIDDESVASLHLILSRKTIGKLHGPPHQQCMSFGQFGEGWNMLCRNDKEMGWSLRVDIFKREQSFSLCHDICRKRSVDNTTEEALRPAHARISDPSAHLIDRTPPASL